MFGLVAKKDFLGKVQTLLGANGVDFKEIVSNVRGQGLTKAADAKAKEEAAAKDLANAKVNFDSAMADAQAAFQKAANAANKKYDEEGKAADNKVRLAARLRAEAKKLADTARYFS